MSAIFSVRRLVSGAILMGVSQQALAHGFVEFPKARQQFCVNDGGYWWPADGSGIPNLACRQAFVEAGTVQFVQNNEFSINVGDYNNLAAVKAAIPNGLLCAAGDNAKRGLDLPSTHYQRTVVTPDANGQIELLFDAHTPHNPSFWQFFLSNSDFNSAAESLSWEKLTLIDELQDQPIVLINGKKFYRIMVTLPHDRSGNATLYTRWQRNDVVGEGFYNCSDISIGAGQGNPDPTPDPTPATWVAAGAYIPTGFSPKVGDEIWFRVFSAQGDERVFERLSITPTNLSNWAQELAGVIATSHSALVQVGVKQATGAIVFSATDMVTNQVWLQAADQSYRLDLKSAPSATVSLTGLASEYALTQGKAQLQLNLSASNSAGQAVETQVTVQTLGTPAGSFVFEQNLNVGEAAQSLAITLNQAGDYLLNVNQLASGQTQQFAFKVKAEVTTPPTACGVSDPAAGQFTAWNASKAYQAGDKVAHLQLVWQAKWWQQGSEPSSNNEAWQLVSVVTQPWANAIAYEQGAQVSHQNKLWQAKWWTRNETPGTGSAWLDKGDYVCP